LWEHDPAPRIGSPAPEAASRGPWRGSRAGVRWVSGVAATVGCLGGCGDPRHSANVSRVSDYAEGMPETPVEPLLLPPAESPRKRRPDERVCAAIEVAVCSGFPTQLLLAYILTQAGFAPSRGQLSISFVATLLLLDAVIVVGLVLSLLRLHGEHPRAVLLGQRPIVNEALIGLPLTIAVFGLVIIILTATQHIAPWLHNVVKNPLAELIGSRRDATIFAVVATLAGGVREEVQRAFILHRFDGYLGGVRVGLVVSSLAFGAGHLLQGWDAALTTGVLGAFWGAVYLSRGSIVAPVVSHSGFNMAEIVLFMAWGGQASTDR
jgi:CAAX protease family protein